MPRRWNRNVLYAAGFGVMAGLACPAAADTIHVPGDYPTIQEGIDAAVNGDEVVVADGIWAGPGNKNLDLAGRLITVRSESGYPGTCIIDCEGDGRAFYFDSGETNEAVISGFTITNAFLSGGGAIRMIDSSPTISHCVFDSNGELYGDGMGGIHLSGGSPVITDCVFTNNVAVRHGGAIYMVDSSPTITNCRFYGNRTDVSVADASGGAIYRSGGSPVISGCEFSGNVASTMDYWAFGGGIYSAGGGLTLSDCSFHGNAASGSHHHTTGGAYGGGLCCWGSATLHNCVFTGNYTGIGGGGGAYISDDALLIDCVFDGNSSSGGGYGYTTRGGGLAVGGGTLVNCVVVNNRTRADGAESYGGGINGSPTMINCLVSNNRTTIGSPARGGGINGSPVLINCTVADNQAEEGGGVYGSPTVSNSVVWGNTPDQIQGGATVSYSCIQGGVAGTGNIADDPLFLDSANGNYRLSSWSPCIDAADNTAVPPEITTDLDGHPRFVDTPWITDTGNGMPPIVDMGSYEHGDCNGNGVPDVWDIINCIGDPDCEDCNNNYVPDGCDLADCQDEPWCDDCNDNGIPDDCDISSGTSQDCNNNGIPDECDLADCQGERWCRDCDNNGIIDVCDEDCNGNGIPDACDMADCQGEIWCGDCNDNGIMDKCDSDLWGQVLFESPELSPIGNGYPQSYTLVAPPEALSDVVLDFEAIADLVHSYRYIDVDLNGVVLGRLFETSGQTCPPQPDVAQLVVPMAVYNTRLSGGDGVITMTASQYVDAFHCNPQTYIKVVVQYVGIIDANNNGIPDMCESLGDTICPDDPSDYLRQFGGVVTGDALDLCASDDVRMEILQSAQLSPLLPFIRLEYWAHSTLADDTITSVEYAIECHVSALVGGGQNPDTLRTWIRNYAGGFEMIDQRGTLATADEVITHTQTTNAADYVNAGDGEVRVRQDVWNPGDVFSPNWFLKVDLYEVTLNQ